MFVQRTSNKLFPPVVPGADAWIGGTMTGGCEKQHKAAAPLSRLGTGRGTAAYITPGHSSLVPLCQSRASFYTVEGVQGVEGEVEGGVEGVVEGIEGAVAGAEGVVDGVECVVEGVECVDV